MRHSVIDCQSIIPITQSPVFHNPPTITQSRNHHITRSAHAPSAASGGAWSTIRSMSAPLQGKRVAILVEDGFEDRELTGPLEALREAGATVTLVGPTRGGSYRGKRGQDSYTSELCVS